MSFSTDDIARAGRTTLRGARLWDLHGLFGNVERDDHGARVFTQDHIDRAKIIAALQMCGKSLPQIKAVFAQPLPGGSVLDEIFNARDFLEHVEILIAADRRQVFDL